MNVLILLFVLATGISFANWTAQTSFTTENINDFHIENNTSAYYAVCNNAKIFKSTNSGSTWADISSNLISSNINSVKFYSSQEGIVTNQIGRVYRTADGGNSFELLSTSSDNHSVNDIYFVHTLNTIIVGDDGVYRKSTNTGSSWDTIPYKFNNSNLNSIGFNGINNGVIVGDGGAIFQTTNGGNDWASKTFSGVNENLNAVTYIGANNTFFGVGDNGRIIRSINNGLTWHTITSGVNANLNAVCFTSNTNVGYIVGDGGVILKTTDAGVTWSQQINNNNSNLYAVKFVNENVGYAFGNGGTFLKTISGGLNQSITLNAPQAGTTWIVNNQVNINWSYSMITNINIEISRDNQNSWGAIASNVLASNLTYSWTVSNPSSEDVFIRISDANNPNLYSISGKFRITDFNLEITSPVANEEVDINSTKKIQWNSQNINNVNIFYSSNNGNSWSTIASNIQANLGEYNWTVPNTATNQAKIKIEDAINSSKFVISNAFTIIGDNLTLTSPNGGNFDAGDQVTIQWNSHNVNKIKIDYTTNGGSTWANIVNNYPASNNQYTWIVPYKPGQAQIRITNVDNSSLFDISEPSFNINGYDLTITNPLGGTYNKNSNLTINWSADPRIVALKIEFSSNNGTNWSQIADNVLASLGAYSWTLPNVAGSQYKIRLTDNTGNIVKVSNTFAVSSLLITSPLNNSTLVADREYTITWEAIGFSNINLKYSSDNGSNWQNIATNVLASQGQINWTTPNFNQALILKIENSSDPNQSNSINLNVQIPSIEITKLVADYFYRSGQPIVIQWTSNLVENVDVLYSFNGGAFVSIANDVVANNGSYTWTAPAIESGNVVVKVVDSGNNSVFDLSNAFGVSDDTITLLSPNGNELWNQGENREISWVASDAINVDIEVSTDNGQTWQLIVSGVSALQPYNWIIGKVPTTTALIRVSDHHKQGIVDVSDNSFKINGLDLQSPNGGETFLLSTPTTINWKSVGVSKVNIYYSKNSGASWTEIVKNYPAGSGFYNWNIPAITGEEFKIRIIDPTKTNFEDVSDNNFKIQGIKITSPVAGDEILFGTQHYITFDKYGIQNVKIEHSTDNGLTWYTVISHYNGSSGQYLWNVPELPGNMNKIKVTSVEVPSLYDITSEQFTILEQGVVVTYPDGGETLTASSSQTITWASANIDNVKIEYSADNGNTWNVITNSTDANNKYYVWNTPNTNGSKYLVRVTDTKISNLSDVSNSNFNISGGVYILPDDWSFTMGTGKTSNIIVPNSIHPIIGSSVIQNGDAIGVFYMVNGVSKCAGYSIWDSNDMAIAVFGDNALTTAKDGFDDNENYSIKVWSKTTGNVNDATVTYSSGNPYFTINGISIISKLETQRPLNIKLEAGNWQLVSSNILPVNTLVKNIFINNLNDFEYVKNQNGQIYYPLQNIDQIVNWNIKEGYLIYAKNDAILQIMGNTIIPSNYSYTFNANMWYMISYLPSDSRNVSSVFANTNSLILVKNDEGKVYYPAFGINQIGNMKVGEGYQLAVSQNSQTFSYSNVASPPVGPVVPGIYSEDEENYYQTEISKTGNSAVIIINNDLELYGEIGVFDGNDRLIGHGMIDNVYSSITIWGDNPATFEKDGAREKETLRIEFYDYNSKSVQKLDITQIFEMMTSKNLGKELQYAKDAIYSIEFSKVTTSVSDNNSSFKIYPNPVKDILYISISGNDLFNIEVFDLSGIKVLTKQFASKGQSTMKLDVSNFNTGTYIIRSIGNSGINTQKFIKIE